MPRYSGHTEVVSRIFFGDYSWYCVQELLRRCDARSVAGGAEGVTDDGTHVVLVEPVEVLPIVLVVGLLLGVAVTIVLLLGADGVVRGHGGVVDGTTYWLLFGLGILKIERNS